MSSIASPHRSGESIPTSDIMSFLFASRPAWLTVIAVLACGRSPEPPAAGADHPPVAVAAPALSLTGAAAPPATSDSLGALADRGRILGDSSARLWLVIISDFQCPYCRQWHDSSSAALRREYVDTRRVRIAYVNLPLPMHANAWPAAEVAMCSSLQGKFWQMHDAIFEAQARWAPLANAAPVFDSLAAKAGVDVKAMRACVQSRVLRPLIQTDYDRSTAAGINSTPTLLVGSTVLEGAVPLSDLRRTLDSALRATSGARR